MLSAFTSRLDDAGTLHCWSASFAATCGSEYSPEPTPALNVPAPFQDDLDASRFSVADALRQFPSVMVPRFGPKGGLAMCQAPVLIRRLSVVGLLARSPQTAPGPGGNQDRAH
jgi:hypothetical protein